MMQVDIVIYTLILFVCHLAASQKVILQRTSKNNGLHREITTQLKFSVDLFSNLVDPSKCRCLILEMLPSSVYVDPYQLNQLLPFGGPDVISPDVDIEKPEYLSAPINIYIFTPSLVYDNREWITNVSLPVHLRYQRPTSVPGQDFQHVIVSDPFIYINCSDVDLTNGEEEKLPCDKTNMMQCKWRKIQYHLETNAVEFDVPIGKKNHSVIVVFGTLIVTVGGCMCIIRTVLQKDRKYKIS